MTMDFEKDTTLAGGFHASLTQAERCEWCKFFRDSSEGKAFIPAADRKVGVGFALQGGVANLDDWTAACIVACEADEAAFALAEKWYAGIEARRAAAETK